MKSVVYIAVALVSLVSPAWAQEWEAVGGPLAASAESRHPVLNSDGSRLAFESTARLVGEDKDNEFDVYLADLPEGRLRRMPRSSRSVYAKGASLSGDGKTIAYYVLERVGRSGIPPMSVILIQDLEYGKTYRVPPTWFGSNADGEALKPKLGKNSRTVVFTTNAPDLGVRREPPYRAVYVYEPDSDRVRLVSRNNDGQPADRQSAQAGISGNGRFVGFLSAATNLHPPLPEDSLAQHLYLVDRALGRLARIDVIEKGFDSDDWIVGRFDMNYDGNHLVFDARKRLPNKPKDSLKTNDLFLYDAHVDKVLKLTSGLFAGKSHSPAISGNGRWIVFVYDGNGSDKGGVVVYDHERDLWRRVADGACANPAISSEGQRIAFESTDPDIVGIKTTKPRIYVAENPSYEPSR